jgi:hypothetical protein
LEIADIAYFHGRIRACFARRRRRSVIGRSGCPRSRS